MPLGIRQSYISDYQKLLDTYNFDNTSESDYNESDHSNYIKVAKNQIMQSISMLTQPTHSNQSILLPQLIQHISKWDKVYQYNAFDVYPELAELLSSNGYTI